MLPFARLWYDAPDNAIGYAMHSSRSRDAVIRLYDAAGKVIETHEQVPEELANYLDPIAKHLAEEVNEISDYLRAELLNE